MPFSTQAARSQLPDSRSIGPTLSWDLCCAGCRIVGFWFGVYRPQSGCIGNSIFKHFRNICSSAMLKELLGSTVARGNLVFIRPKPRNEAAALVPLLIPTARLCVSFRISLFRREVAPARSSSDQKSFGTVPCASETFLR